MSSENSTQLMIIFFGPPGSGKSTLSIPWCKTFQNWVRINQDDLGSRKNCEWKAQKALSEGKSVIIDRCNFDQSQRKVWIQIAKKFQIYVDCLVFRVPFEVLKKRILSRQNHPTGVEGAQGVGILSEFCSNLRPPSLKEGIDRIVTFSAVNGPDFEDKTWNWLARAFSAPIAFQIQFQSSPRNTDISTATITSDEKSSKQVQKNISNQNSCKSTYSQNHFAYLEFSEED